MTVTQSVLAIADDPDTRTALRAQLIGRVGELRLVATSVEARQLLRSWRPSVIIWRIRMPTMDDLSLAREAKELAAQPPILYLHRVADLPALIEKLALLR